MRNVFLILSAVVNTVVRFDIFNVEYAPDRCTYYTGQATSYFLMMLAFHPKIRQPKNYIIPNAVLWLSVSNLMDELFFDPTNFGANEIFFTIVIGIHTIITLIKNRNVTNGENIK